MYFLSLVAWLFAPFALGSYVTLPAFLALTPFYALRLRGEEEFLRRELPGYDRYCLQTRYRLIPFVW